MWNALRFIAHEYEWIHTGIGIVGNTAFFAGSILFFWKSLQTAGVWLFVVGSAGMLIGSVGGALVGWERRRRRRVESTRRGARPMAQADAA